MKQKIKRKQREVPHVKTHAVKLLYGNRNEKQQWVG